MKKQEISIAKCGDCARYQGGDKGFICPELDKTGIENAVVYKDSVACNEKIAKAVKVKKILGGWFSLSIDKV
jgi:hypothetical protein